MGVIEENKNTDSPIKDGKYIKGLVSVIIPAHQSEAFIERSVGSVLNQNYSAVEVIAVENGSEDRTLELLYSMREKDFRLHIYQSEKGVSNARNKGIDNCRGEFLLFLDADDWLEKDAIEQLIHRMDEDVDIVSARYFGDKPFETYEYKRYEADSDDYIIKCLRTPTKRGNCTGNLYRAGFLRNNDIKFDPELNHAEDTVFFTNILVRNPIVVDLEKPVYHVFSNPNSATRTGKKDLTDDFCRSLKRLYHILSNSSKDVMNAGYICALNQMLVILVNNGNSLMEQIKLEKLMFQKEEFSEAILNADLSGVKGPMKHIFTVMKKKMYVLLAVIANTRARLNVYRRRKERV